MTNTPDDDTTPSKPKPAKRIGKRLLDAKKQQDICAIIAVGSTRTKAAAYVGCCTETIRMTALREPEFAEALRKAEAQHEIALLTRIDAASKRPEGWRAAAWALQRMYPERFARQARMMSPVQVENALAQFAQVLMRGIRDADDRKRVSNELRLITAVIAKQTEGEQPG